MLEMMKENKSLYILLSLSVHFLPRSLGNYIYSGKNFTTMFG